MTKEEWFECHGAEPGDIETVYENLTLVSEEELEFEDTLDYIESWPDKFYDFMEGNKGEPWLETFLEKFRAFANKPGKGGPVFEEWRKQ